MTIIFIVPGCLLIIAAVALLVTAWVIGVAAAVSMFYIGYEAWNAPDTCRGFCSVFSHEQGFNIMYIMGLSLAALVAFMVLALKSIKKAD
ncbi:hypothetical protein FE103_21185 [Salmonella enterica]|nr:hypothetical protein [Salmonella enterica]ECT4917980.1 hypothetical protein [Salmonella enterica subsp. enterica serovar Newport]ECU9588110.1 hypothetical protein [Salmonella enterica subsp. enterica serovar Gaminara]EDM1377065.1 hypothetical protein [Salmonella enterica subsp. enterica serovar Poona]EDT6860567.1 hypothetical protein [Salmonella enterica subsp. enterica]